MLQDIGCAMVNIAGRNDMVARHQALKNGGHSCQARAESGTGRAAFERGQCSFQTIAVGIVVA